MRRDSGRRVTAKQFERMIKTDTEDSDVIRALKNISLSEIKKVKTLLPLEGFILPVVDVKNEPLSLLVFKNFRFELLRVKSRLGGAHSLSSAIQDLDERVHLAPAFWNLLEEYGDAGGSKERHLNKVIRIELTPHIDDALSKVDVLINEALDAHQHRFPIFTSKLLEIDEYIFVRSVHALGWLNSYLPKPVESISTEIREIADSMAPTYSRIEILERLQASSPLFSQSYLDVDLSDVAYRRWERSDISIPQHVSQLILEESNLASGRLKPAYQVISPKETLSEVVLPKKTKSHVKALCDHFKRARSNHTRLTFLLTGPAGTGKSLTARAIAKELGMDILMVNLSEYSGRATPQLVAMFAERAKVGKHLLVFDECEDLLSWNPFQGTSDSWAKLLFERFVGAAIFITNYGVPYGFDRRVTYTINFKAQPSEVRKQVLNANVNALAKELDLKEVPTRKAIEDLASNHKISAGYYQQILQLAVAQSPDGRLNTPALEDAFLHAESVIDHENLDEIREPNISLGDVQLASSLREEVNSFVSFAKAANRNRSPLMPKGATALFSGPSGTGKTITAEAIATQLEMPIRRVSPSTFLSKWVGETEERIRKVFKEAQYEKYLLFIDEAEGLFLDRKGSRASWETTRANELLQQVEAFSGTLVIATNHTEMMDAAFARRFLFHMKFDPPDLTTRASLWSIWASQLNLDQGSIKVLALKYELTGGEIRNIAIRAKARSKFTITDLETMCHETINSRTGLDTRKIGI
jgi:SpoVK/Ycf46/Vps4 family AAA+-type ATPase